MKLKFEKKLKMCAEIYRSYKPMYDATEKWYLSLPKGLEIKIPFDYIKLFEDSIKAITGISVGDEWLLLPETEEQFIAELKELMYDELRNNWCWKSK